MPVERYNELLAAAIRVAVSQGLVRVTLRSVAAAAGVTGGLVTHYFDTVDTLISTAFRSAAEADLEVARARVDAAITPTGQLNAMIDHLFAAESLDATALWVDASSLGRHNQAVAAVANELDGQWLDLLGGIVAAGVASGEFTANAPQIVARRLLTIIDGLGTQAVVGALPLAELTEIARDFANHELGLTAVRGAVDAAH
jgi:AcrR family transcriptional regulator